VLQGRTSLHTVQDGAQDESARSLILSTVYVGQDKRQIILTLVIINTMEILIVLINNINYLVLLLNKLI